MEVRLHIHPYYQIEATLSACAGEWTLPLLYPLLHSETSDGCAGSLAVGHGWHSLNVWDTSQWCRPMTTFPRVPQTPTETPSLGIACIVWGYRGYRLLVAQNEVSPLAPNANTPACM